MKAEQGERLQNERFWLFWGYILLLKNWRFLLSTWKNTDFDYFWANMYRSNPTKGKSHCKSLMKSNARCLTSIKDEGRNSLGFCSAIPRLEACWKIGDFFYYAWNERFCLFCSQCKKTRRCARSRNSLGFCGAIFRLSLLKNWRFFLIRVK